MKRFFFAFIFLLLLVLGISFWFRREQREARLARMRAVAQEEEQGTSSTRPPPGEAPSAEEANVSPPPDAKRRGLWLLEGDEAARAVGPVEPHPWLEYIAKRNAVFAEWEAASLAINIEELPLTGLPGLFGEKTGLVLRVDPTIAAESKLVTFKVNDLDASRSLDLLTRMAALRMTVGADGFMWVVGKEKAACEPEFIEDLRAWETAVASREPDSRGEARRTEVKGALTATRQRVEIVSIPINEALAKLSELYGVKIKDRRSLPRPNPDAPLGAPGSERVTLVRESVTLEEALREILAPLELDYFPDRTIEVHRKEDIDLFEKEAQNRNKEEAARTAKLQEFLSRIVKLDGSPLSVEQIAVSIAQQVGLKTQLDPLLRASTARWKAVEAEMRLGEVLSALERGCGCECEIHRAPSHDLTFPADAWILWVFASRPATAQPEGK